MSDCTSIDFIPDPFGIGFAPLQGACHGNGACVDSRCVCEDGFTGRSDFINTEGFDCQINELVIRILWGVLLVVGVAYLAMSIPRIKLRWKSYQETKLQKALNGHKYGLRNNRGMAAVLVSTFIAQPGVLGLALVRLIDQEQRIGLTFLATLCWFLGKVGFYTAVWFFQPSLIASILGKNRATKRIVSLTYKLSALLSGIGYVVAVAPFFTYFLSDGTDSIAVAVFYVVMGGTFIQVLFLGIQAYWTKVKVTKALDLSYSMTKSERTLEMKRALVAVERENIVQTSIQGVVFLLFLILPFFANVHDYFLPISWLAYVVLGKKIAFTAVADKANTGSQTDSNSATRSKNTGSKDASSFQGTNTFTGSYSPQSQLPTNGTTLMRNFEAQVTSFVEQPGSENEDDFV